MTVRPFILSAVAAAAGAVSGGGPVAAKDYDFTSSLPADWTFTRASTTEAIVGTQFAPVAANQPRIESWGGVSRGVAVDGATTAYLQKGSAPETMGAGGFTVASASGQALPNGTTGSVAQFTETAEPGAHTWTWGFDNPPAGVGTFWVVWRNVGSVQRNLFLWANDQVEAAFRHDRGAFDYVSPNNTTATSGRIQLADGWQLSWLTYDLGETAPGFIRGATRPLETVEWGGHDGSTDAAIQIWHAQYVSGRRIGPRILVPANTAVSSVAESLSTSSLNSISATSGTFVIEHDATASGATILSLGSGAITVPAASAQTGYQTQRLAVAYNAGGTRIVNNGGAEATGAALAFGSGLAFGQGVHIKRIRWYAQELTEAQMWELTRPPITGSAGVANALRIAGVRAQLPYDQRGPCGANRKVMIRFVDKIGSGARRNLRLSFNNRGIFTDGEFDNTNTVTVAGHVLINGVSVPAAFGGSASGVMAIGDVDYKSDALLPSAFGLSEFPVGTEVEQRIEYTLPDTGSYIMCGQFGRDGIPGLSQMVTFDPTATTVVSGTSGTGAFTFSGASPSTDIFGAGRVPVAVLLGEFTTAAGDPKTFHVTGASMTDDARCYLRQAAEIATNGPWSMVTVSVGGIDSRDYYVPTPTMWTAYLQYARVGITELGVNDASSQQMHQPIWDMYRSAPSIAHFAAIKHTPLCGSSDNWATAGGMQRTGGSTLAQMRARRLIKQRALNSGYIDTIINTDAAVQQSPYDDELFYANGTPQYMTDDGGHFTLSGHTHVAPSVAAQLDAIEIPA